MVIMQHFPRKLTASLLIFALGILAVALWLDLRLRDASPNQPQSAVCEGWKMAEIVTQGLDWDLTYEPLFRRNELCPGDPFCEIVANRHPKVEGRIPGRQGDPIISSILIELPDGHAGMGASWAVRTKDSAYLWAFHADETNIVSKQPIPTLDYDRVFEETACWRQGEPSNRKFGEKGYIGFLSLYKEGKSRQMLLTHNDLDEGNTSPGEDKPGRFFKALEPLRSCW